MLIFNVIDHKSTIIDHKSTIIDHKSTIIDHKSTIIDHNAMYQQLYDYTEVTNMDIECITRAAGDTLIGHNTLHQHLYYTHKHTQAGEAQS